MERRTLQKRRESHSTTNVTVSSVLIKSTHTYECLHCKTQQHTTTLTRKKNTERQERKRRRSYPRKSPFCVVLQSASSEYTCVREILRCRSVNKRIKRMAEEVVDEEDPFEIEDDLATEGENREDEEKVASKKNQGDKDDVDILPNDDVSRESSDVCGEDTEEEEEEESSKTAGDVEAESQTKEKIQKRKKKKKKKKKKKQRKDDKKREEENVQSTSVNVSAITSESSENKILGLRQEIEALNAELAVMRRQHKESNEENRRISQKYDEVSKERDTIRKKMETEDAEREKRALETANGGNQRTLTQRLVDLGEKNYNLAQKCKQFKEEAEKFGQEIESARHNLLSRIVDSDPCTDAKHVALEELCNLFVQKVTAGGEGRGFESSTLLTTSGVEGSRLGKECSSSAITSSVATYSAPVNTLQIAELEKKLSDLRTHNRQQTSKIEKMRREVEDAREKEDQLKSYADMCHSFRAKLEREKTCRMRAEKNVASANERIVGLSEQVKKLTIHLKHESTKKLKEHKRAMRLEREVEALTNRTATLSRKNAQRERVISELREGSKILEDQLRLMDKKYIELRSRLDWTRTHSKIQVKKMQKEANALRAKWALAGGLDLELLARKSKKKGGKVSKQLSALVKTGASMTQGIGASEDPEDPKDMPDTEPRDDVVAGEQKRSVPSSVTLPPFPSATRPPSSKQKTRKKSEESSTRVEDALPWSAKGIGRLTQEMKGGAY